MAQGFGCVTVVVVRCRVPNTCYTLDSGIGEDPDQRVALVLRRQIIGPRVVAGFGPNDPDLDTLDLHVGGA